MTELLGRIPPEILERIGDLSLKVESQNCQEAIEELISNTVLSGGKRLRPMITFLMGRVLTDKLDSLDPFAKSIEMVHAASLAHDDVVDNATTRRGEPSINIVSSNKRAVLAGDYLLANVIFQLAHQGDLKIVQKMSSVITDLAVGEWVQSDAIEHRNYSKDIIERIAFLKTATVMSFCTWVSAHLENLSENTCVDAYNVGKNIGLAFQLMDDTLDFSNDSKKDKLLDIKNNIVNSVVLEWLELNPNKFSEYKNGADLIDLWSDDHLEQAISNVKERAYLYMVDAQASLKAVCKESKLGEELALERATPLFYIMEFIINRKF